MLKFDILTYAEVHPIQNTSNPRRLGGRFTEILQKLDVKYSKREADTIDDDVCEERGDHDYPTEPSVWRHHSHL